MLLRRKTHMPTEQLILPLDVELVPTPAMRKGQSRVDQCSWCGLLVCGDAGVKLGACPACGCEQWWRQDKAPFDRAHWAGPFHYRKPVTA